MASKTLGYFVSMSRVLASKIKTKMDKGKLSIANGSCEQSIR